MNIKENENKKYIFMKNKQLYFEYYETFVDRYLQICEKEKAENNKYANTIDYRLGAALLNPIRQMKWFVLNLFKKSKLK
jgi:hypothetical protein